MDNITVDVKKKLIKNQSCFSRLTDSEIDELSNLWTETHFAAGDTIVVEGDPVDSVYLIVSGTADVQHISLKDGIKHTESITTLGPGKAVGLDETGFYSLSGLRTATVIALTDIISLRLSVTEFHGFKLAYSHVNEVMRTTFESIPSLK